MRTARRVDRAIDLAAAGAPTLRMDPNLRSFTRVRLTVPASLPMPVSRSVYGADLDEQGSTLFAVGDDGATHLVFGSGAVVPLPEPILSPAVRLLAPDVALVARRRVFLEGEKNAGLIGPTLFTIAAAMLLDLGSFPVFAEQVSREPALIFLPGILLFIAGVAIVRAHKIWVGGWPVLVTVLGWLAILGGLVRLLLAFRGRKLLHA